MEATRYTKGKDFCLDINPLLFPERIDDQKKNLCNRGERSRISLSYSIFSLENCWGNKLGEPIEYRTDPSFPFPIFDRALGRKLDRQVCDTRFLIPSRDPGWHTTSLARKERARVCGNRWRLNRRDERRLEIGSTFRELCSLLDWIRGLRARY